MPKPVSSTSSSHSAPSNTEFLRSKAGHLVPNGRVYKPKISSRGRRGRPVNRNMTLTNSRRPYQSVYQSDASVDVGLTQFHRPRRSPKKYSDKPCPRFTTTGAAVAQTIQTVFPSMLFFIPRRMYSWPHLYLSTRSDQDCHMLELPSRPLSKHS